MECRPVEIKVISASGIKDVNKLSKMDVYVVVSVSGDPKSVQRSPIDKDGGINPRWHHYDMKFVVDEVAAQNSRIGFVFQIMSNRTLGDKESGRVYIPVKELLDHYGVGANAEYSPGAARPHLEAEYQVRTQTGKLKGTFKFSYAFGEKFTREAPQMEEPPPPLGYLAVVPTGVAPAAYPYGVVAMAPRPAAGGDGSGGKYGMGAAAAAAGVGMGLLGGLLIGEMVDDVADI